jgi:hypothetical protein
VTVVLAGKFFTVHVVSTLALRIGILVTSHTSEALF